MNKNELQKALFDSVQEVRINGRNSQDFNRQTKNIGQALRGFVGFSINDITEENEEEEEDDEQEDEQE